MKIHRAHRKDRRLAIALLFTMLGLVGCSGVAYDEAEWGTRVRWAAGTQSADVLERELALRPQDLEVRGPHRMSPLETAASSGRTENVRILLEHGAEVDRRDPEFETTALHEACIHGWPECARLLLEAGADADAANRWGSTPLVYACMVTTRGHHGAMQTVENAARTVEVLIAAGADVNHVDLHGRTPLLDACGLGGDTERVALLLAAGADPNQTTRAGSPLRHAWRDAAILDLLLDAGADPNGRLPDGSTQLIAAAGSDWGPVAALLDAGADVDAVDAHGRTALDVAVAANQFGHVHTLVYAGADPARHGLTLLHVAVMGQDEAWMRTLLAEGADVDAPDDRGRTPLMLALPTFRGDRLTEILLDAGADVHARDRDGRTPLYYVTDSWNVHRAMTLIDHGARVNVQDHLGRSPLLVIVEETIGRELVEALIEAGAVVDLADDTGRTPLLVAARDASWVNVEVLIEAGADPSRRDLEGRDARDWCRHGAAQVTRHHPYQHEKTYEILQSALDGTYHRQRWLTLKEHEARWEYP